MEESSPKLRGARTDDLAGLLRLEERTFSSDRFTRDQFRHLLTRANATALVVTVAGSIVANAFMLWRSNSKKGHLYTIAVDPDFHGKGIGKQLLLACEAEARKRGCDQIILEVRQDNTGAIALYQKHGYQVTGVMKHYYEDNSDAYKMTRSLA